MRLAVLDARQPWVRALITALPFGVDIEFIEPRGPSWTRWPGLSAWLTSRRIGSVDTIVYTLPHYAPVAERLAAIPSVYYAYDPYECYEGWDPVWIRRQEDRLLRTCRAAFAVSPALADDFRARSSRPVFVQPNGVTLPTSSDPGPRPRDLPERPVALCVGQLSSAYDWPLIDAVAAALPDWHLVFVGPGHQPPSRPNVVFLGARPPSELASYMNHADVLFSPLTVCSANHRRSLLRILEYLTTDRPIVATPIASCVEHAPHVMLADDPAEFASRIRGPHLLIDRPARQAYVAQLSWTERATLFLTNLRRVVPEFASHA